MDHPMSDTRVRRHPERGHYDKSTIHAILDAGVFCHVAIVRNGMPIVIPTLYVRIADHLYIHGAVASGLLKNLAPDTMVSVAVTLLDGLVMARSAYNHSMNYRSVVLFGRAREVKEPREKLAVLEAMVNQVTPGRWQDARQPNEQEIKTTRVFGIPIDQASAKIRSGPPVDDAEDMDLPVWAGILPLKATYGRPIADPQQQPPVPFPSYLQNLIEGFDPKT